MKILALGTLALVVACASTPQYNKDITTSPSGAVTIRLDSVGDMSAAAMRSALLTEAARETINRSEVYLRVEELSTDTSIDVKKQTEVPVAPAPTSSPNDPYRPPQTTGVTLSRHRSGVVRFVVSRERPANGEVYDASQLLDQIRAGKTP